MYAPIHEFIREEFSLANTNVAQTQKAYDFCVKLAIQANGGCNYNPDSEFSCWKLVYRCGVAMQRGAEDKWLQLLDAIHMSWTPFGFLTPLFTLLGFLLSASFSLYLLYWILKCVFATLRFVNKCSSRVERKLTRKVIKWISRVKADMCDPEYLDGKEEAMLPSSPFTPTVKERCPKFTFAVYLQVPSTAQFEYYGMGCWVGNYFLTPRHILNKVRSADQCIRLLNLVDDRTVDTVSSDWTTLVDEDVAYMVPSQRLTTKLGVKKAGVRAIEGRITVSVTAKQQTSSGSLKPNPMDPVTQVTYVGSTVGGFSGAPYYVGNTVYGMHLGSNQKHGTGLNMTYLLALINRREDSMVEESSEDIILGEMRRMFETKGKRYHAARSGGDPDEIYVSYGRGVIVIDQAKYDEFLEVFEDTGRPSRNSRMTEESSYVDADGLDEDLAKVPKNLMKPLKREAAKGIEQIELKPMANAAANGVTPVESVQMLQDAMSKLQIALTGLVKQLENTGGPKSTPVPQREASPTTSESSSVSTAQRRNRRRRKSPTPSTSQSSTSTLGGESGSSTMEPRV